MADAPNLISGEVQKGGERWLEVLLERRADHLVIWARTDPRVEEFMKGLAGGSAKLYKLSDFNNVWKDGDKDKPIQVYNLSKDIDTHAYTINSIGGHMGGDPMLGTVANISFLRFVGIGSGEGVKFAIEGPIGRDTINTMKNSILGAARQLFRDYVVPVRINLRITSTEL